MVARRHRSRSLPPRARERDCRRGHPEGTFPLNQLTTVPDDVPEEYPAWSPDGSRLAFTSHREGTSGPSEVWVIARDGSGLANLTDHPALENHGSWSPDGKWLSFNSNRSGDGDVYIRDSDGGSVRQRTTGEYLEGGAVWSPDGRFIAFTARTVPSAETGNLSIWVMRADGSGARLIFDSPGEDLGLSWTR